MREPEPFRIKMIEPIRRTTRDEREAIIAGAGYNLFDVRADDVMVDLLTDSGTGAMSHTQWGSLMQGDESYAGSKSFHRFRDTIEDIFGFEYVVPTHQGRAAEHLYFGMMLGAGKTVLANAHFDTTRAHVEITGAQAIDLPCIESADLQAAAPFKGDIDLERLEKLLAPGSDLDGGLRRHDADQQHRWRPASLDGEPAQRNHAGARCWRAHGARYRTLRRECLLRAAA